MPRVAASRLSLVGKLDLLPAARWETATNQNLPLLGQKLPPQARSLHVFFKGAAGGAAADVDGPPCDGPESNDDMLPATLARGPPAPGAPYPEPCTIDGSEPADSKDPIDPMDATDADRVARGMGSPARG